MLSTPPNSQSGWRLNTYPSEKYESAGMMKFPTVSGHMKVMFQTPPTSLLLKMIVYVASFPIINGDFPWLCKRLLDG